MARTRTPGIRVDRDGRRIIDKDYRGVAIYLRLGSVGQERAEQRLADEIAGLMLSLTQRASASAVRGLRGALSRRVAK